MKVVWSPEAKDDIMAALNYIEHDLGSPMAAARLYGAVKEKIALLAAVPGASVVLKKDGQPSRFKYAIAGNWMIFVTYSNDFMHVVRILYGKSDYMKALFM